MEISTIILYLVIAAVSLVVFYNIVKAAVRNGIREARKDLGSPKPVTRVEEKPLTEKQKDLQQKYNRGEITFEEYKVEWNRPAPI